MTVRTLPFALAAALCAFGPSPAGAQDAPAQAQEILRAAGLTGGLVVHVGCGDGALTAALRAGEGIRVHGIDTDAANVEKARAHVRSLGLYGAPVAVDRFDGRRLPYIDNLVNLVVAGTLGEVPTEEAMRVLAPKGALLVKEGGAWKKTVKPRPADHDDWTHYLYDPSNNAVSKDRQVAPLRHLQWIGGPRYSRQHDHMSGASAMVVSDGRLFAIFDHASPMAIQLPSQWKLVARDAFNGTVLWTRPIETWHTQMFRLKSGPVQITRRLVAVDGRIYVTLGWEAPVSALDPATGKTLHTFEGTAGTEEILVRDGLLFAVINDKPFRQPADPKDYVYDWPEGARRIAAFEASTGKRRWETARPNVLPCTLTADARRLLFCDGERIHCLDPKTGDAVWVSEPVERRKPIASHFAPTLVLTGDTVLFSGGGKSTPTKNAGGVDNDMIALSAADGKLLWTAAHPASGYKSPEDIFVIGDRVWTTTTTFGTLDGMTTGHDLKTGKAVVSFKPDVETHWFHHRCYRAKATEKYILTSRTGIEFIDPQTKHWEIHHWVRGACLYGILPANGMVYNPPHPCACYLEAKLYGFNAPRPRLADPRGPPRRARRGAPGAGAGLRTNPESGARNPE